MKIIVWLVEATWQACVDAARDLPAASVTLLHVIDEGVVEAVSGARAGLLGRAAPGTDTAARRELLAAQQALLAAAEGRLGRSAERLAQIGRPARQVLAACAGADLLVLARDGDHVRLGPRSIGHVSRFVLDHASCQVLLVWPDTPPSALPPDPPPPPPPPHPPGVSS
ncbi:universal stress protein [Streptosporangiaceae bacterium NEAU-GS5]|nr:universal stress protein [Streptosporangiaceae bacterium NEAU-GS5]